MASSGQVGIVRVRTWSDSSWRSCDTTRMVHSCFTFPEHTGSGNARGDAAAVPGVQQQCLIVETVLATQAKGG